MKFKNIKKMNHTQDQNRNRDLMKGMKTRPLKQNHNFSKEKSKCLYHKQLNLQGKKAFKIRGDL